MRKEHDVQVLRLRAAADETKRGTWTAVDERTRFAIDPYEIPAARAAVDEIGAAGAEHLHLNPGTITRVRQTVRRRPYRVQQEYGEERHSAAIHVGSKRARGVGPGTLRSAARRKITIAEPKAGTVIAATRDSGSSESDRQSSSRRVSRSSRFPSPSVVTLRVWDDSTHSSPQYSLDCRYSCRRSFGKIRHSTDTGRYKEWFRSCPSALRNPATLGNASSIKSTRRFDAYEII